VDSFGFAAEALPCAGGTRRAKRVKNWIVWVSVPVEDIEKFRYRDLYRLKNGRIVVQDVLGEKKPIEKVSPGFLLHREFPE
jgi:hypothetical protein